MNFRHDINGLRAIAVIAVVLFHFNPTWVPGGFAGVDVFFVISGFLMTGIIFRGLENNDFNLFKFYVARANRIIPALAVLCTVLLVFGWFYLTPMDYKALGKHAASSMGFLSNVIYWRESGYFDAASHEKWLLHTWSLSVEWQFYIIYPVVLMALKKFLSIANIKRLLVVSTLMGFAFSVVATIKWPGGAYYLLPTRAWEMMFGGLAYLYPVPLKAKNKKLAEYAGLTLILSSYALISSEVAWPGHWALVPVLGAYLIIVANRQDSIVTNNPLLQALGKWSYSIYLWHWPVVVLSAYFHFTDNSLNGIVTSVLLGFLSFRFVEGIKSRKMESWSEILKVKPVFIALGVGLLSSFVFISNGVISHYSEAVLLAISEAQNRNPYECMRGETTPDGFSPCFIGNRDNVTAIVVGDSHADAISTSISSLFDLESEGLVFLTRASCPMLLGAKSNRNGLTCYNENLKRLEFINDYPKVPVVNIGRWSGYMYGQSNPDRIRKGDNRPSMYFGEERYMTKDKLLAEFSTHLTLTLCELSNSHPVIITLPVPEMRLNVPRFLSRALLRDGESVDLALDYELYRERNEGVRTIIKDAAAHCGSKVVDPTEILCNSNSCIAHVKGRPIYYDGDHMSEFGNKLLSPLFKEKLKEISLTSH